MKLNIPQLVFVISAGVGKRSIPLMDLFGLFVPGVCDWYKKTFLE